MGGNRKISYLIFPVILTVALSFAAPAYAGDIFHNPSYGYEIEILPDRTMDMSAYPGTVVWGIGEGGRLVVDVITLEDEYELLTSQDYADTAMAGLESGFEEFVIIEEGWSVSPRRLEVYDINFEFTADYEIMRGTARVAFGTTALLVVYYDDPRDFEYYLPDISQTIESINIDEFLVDPGMEIEVTDGEPLEFIDPSIILFKNESYLYECPNPPGLVPEEINGAGWVVFSTGEGEIAIRYLDIYVNSGKQADVILDEMLPELLATFSKYEIVEGIDVILDDGRSGHALDLTAIYNGYDWMGTFVCFESDFGEPFILTLLSPIEEYEKYTDSFEQMWKSFTFVEEI